jgi:endonuclease-3
MASVSRTAQFAKLHKVLKKCYKPVTGDLNRPVLEHLLFACCLEDAHYETAEEAFAALVHSFFDWNEVRVTSIAELSEVMACLPDPRAAANRIKRILHAVFEATYAFDLEEHRKKNLGPTVKWLEKLDGSTPFAVAYVVQAALGGHSIPIDGGTMRVLRLLDLVTDKDAESCAVPGLERAIAKSKGVEFGALLHQLGADFTANPYAPTVRDVLLQIDPDIKDKLPKRRADKPAKKPDESEGAAAPPAAERSAAPAQKAATVGGAKKRAAEPQKPPETGTAELPADAAKKRPAAAKKKPAEPAVEPAPARPEAAKKKSPAAGLAKRKPR